METFTNDVLAWFLGYLLSKLLSRALKQVPCAQGTEPWCLIHLLIQTMVGESHHVSQPHKISNCTLSGIEDNVANSGGNVYIEHDAHFILQVGNIAIAMAGQKNSLFGVTRYSPTSGGTFLLFFA